MDEQQYTEWFNKGYELSRRKPGLTDSIIKALEDSNDDRATGFKDGHKQYALDMNQNKQPGYMKRQNYVPKSLHNHTPDKDKSKGKDRD